MRMRLLASVFLLPSGLAGAALINDLSTWTEYEDPPSAAMSATIESGVARLGAKGAVSSGTDVGYASVDGPDVAGSTSGYYFDPAADFSIAVDFDQSASTSIGGGAIGFGIGEDRDGRNSAGVVLGFVNGAAVVFASGARVNDVDLPALPLVSGFSVGRFFVEYRSAVGDVIVGVNATPGASAPSVQATIAGVQNLWGDDPLLVSFFLRSQAVSPIPALSSGSVTALFSGFEVLSGSPITIPEPTAAALASLALLASSFPRKGRFRR